MEILGYVVAVWVFGAVVYRVVSDKPLKETLLWPRDVFNYFR